MCVIDGKYNPSSTTQFCERTDAQRRITPRPFVGFFCHRNSCAVGLHATQVEQLHPTYTNTLRATPLILSHARLLAQISLPQISWRRHLKHQQ